MLAVALVAVLTPMVARAAECPETPPAAMKDRRSLAKDWFTRAETEELAADHAAAVKAYACSFAMLPHPSTAYNLARAAERAGDLKLAVSAHRDYLTLKPTASDRPEVEDRIKALEEKLATTGDTASTPIPPPVIAQPDPVPPPPPVVQPRRKARREDPESGGRRMGTTEWVIAGVGAAALVAGVVFNVGARAAMSDCRTLAAGNKVGPARDTCDRAKRFAYLSYGLFGAAGAAAIVDLTLVLGKGRSVESVGMVVAPGGAALTLSGRF